MSEPTTASNIAFYASITAIIVAAIAAFSVCTSGPAMLRAGTSWTAECERVCEGRVESVTANGDTYKCYCK